MNYALLDLFEIITMAMLVIVVILVAYHQYAAPNKNQQNDFVAIASHQLRTPLTIMRGYISMLLGGDFGAIDNKRQQAALTAVYQANERLLNLVENLLGVSQLENRTRLTIKKSTVDVSTMIREIVKDIKPKASVKNLLLKTNLPNKSISLKADEILLRQVILNLVDNAIKYTERGEVIISAAELKNRIHISVVDTGPGVKTSDLERIFDKFERRNVSGSKEDGFGLGLYASKLIVEAHQGRIWAENRNKAAGLVVNFEIPLA